MKILVFGAGAIGSVLGGFLARMGHDVSLLGRPRHLDKIAKDALCIGGIWGDFRTKAFTLYRSSSEIPRDAAFDLVLLTVKSFDTEKAVDELVPLLDTGAQHAAPLLVSFQNGLGNIETILKKIPADRYLAGRAIFGADLEPGVVIITVNADDLVIGALPGTRPIVDAETIAQVFRLAKLPTRAVPDILTHVWAKVIYNCALNGICALHEIPYGAILKDSGLKAWMEAIVRECYAVGLKKGVALKPPNAADFLRLLEDELIPKTAAHYPSMLRDLKRGRPLELDALNGAIARIGEDLGMPTPANKKLIESLKNK